MIMILCVIRGVSDPPTQIDLNSVLLPQGYDPKKELKIIIHGYAGNTVLDHTPKITQGQ